MAISMKKIRQKAMEYRCTSGWNEKRDIIRYVYDYSPKRDRRINLEFFRECAGIETKDELYQRGELNVHIRAKQYRKRGKLVDYDQIRGEIFGGSKKKFKIDEHLDRGSTGKRTKGGGKVNTKVGQYFG